MRRISVSCPVCRSTIPIYEDERTPSGTCGRCSTHIELPPAAFEALYAREGAEAAADTEIAIPRAPLISPPPEPPGPAAPAAPEAEQPTSALETRQPPAGPAVPLPEGRIVIERDERSGQAKRESEPVAGARLDLFESPKRGGIVGAYFHHRKRRATQVPTWLVVWLIALGTLLIGGIVAYLIWLSV